MEKRNFDLEQFRVGETSTVYYIPEFISKEEETKLLENVFSKTKLFSFFFFEIIDYLLRNSLKVI